MQIANAEFSALDVNWKVDLATTGQILDITIPAVFRTTWNCTCTFTTYLLLDLLRGCTSVNIGWIWRLSNDSVKLCGGDQLSFPSVPFCQNFCGRCTAKDTGMDQSSELDTGNVSGSAVDAFEVPDSFGPGSVSEGVSIEMGSRTPQGRSHPRTRLRCPC